MFLLVCGSIIAVFNIKSHRNTHAPIKYSQSNTRWYNLKSKSHLWLVNPQSGVTKQRLAAMIICLCLHYSFPYLPVFQFLSILVFQYCMRWMLNIPKQMSSIVTCIGLLCNGYSYTPPSPLTGTLKPLPPGLTRWSVPRRDSLRSPPILPSFCVLMFFLSPVEKISLTNS